jgi:hypothetical protein
MEDNMPDFNELEKVYKRAHDVMEKSKKLTTKQRKNLKKATFCGPNRSFPVPDCKHVAVAKAYLGRSNFSASTKKRIAACINRKAKQLGCDVSKKAKAAERDYAFYRELSAEEKDIYRSDVFETTRNLVEESIKNPDMELFDEASDLGCGDCDE